MLQYGLPVLFTLFVWWFSTGAILYLDGLPRWTFRWSLLLATLALAFTLWLTPTIAIQTTNASAYSAFSSGIVAWGWVEMSFLMGFITGPRRTDCPPGSTGWRRTQFAIEAILYHEFAIITVAGLLALLSWNLPNQVCVETFFVLWILRLSAKLNVFLGVRNLGEEFLPEHLRYLQTYFSRKAMNLLFPFSVTAATITAALLWKGAISAPDHSFRSLQDTFLATLLTLAVVEHWLLILPIPASSALWSWGFSSRHGGEADNLPSPPSRAGNIAVAPKAVTSAGL